jgi:hypothetical protein
MLLNEKFALEFSVSSKLFTDSILFCTLSTPFHVEDTNLNNPKADLTSRLIVHLTRPLKRFSGLKIAPRILLVA